MIAAVAFWVSFAGILYIFFGYPLLVGLAARFCRHKEALSKQSDATISVLIAVGNEASRLPAKIDSLLASAGSERIVEIVIGSDGSTDDTVSVLENYPDSRLRVVAFEQRRGKSAVLADLIPTLVGELVIFTDARQHVSPNAVKAMSQRLSNPEIGVVSGELVFNETTSTNASRGVGFYWKYEKFLRKSESAFRSVPGATGALYAVRRTVLSAPPADAILDDVAIPMLAVEQGVRCVFEPEATAYDTPSQSTKQESIRKRRTIAGVIQLVRQHPRWLLPRLLSRRGNPIWWEFMSHKVARLFAPPLLAVCLFSNGYLACLSPSYAVLLVFQALFYAAALGGFAAQNAGVRVKALAPPMMFLSLNWTTVLALLDAARGKFNAAWQRAA